jgi:hypothetical protein
MYTALRAHEAQHENIADSWQAILEGRLGGGFYSETARNRAQADAKGAGKIASDWQSWLNDHSADQDSIDPYTAIIECPSP